MAASVRRETTTTATATATVATTSRVAVSPTPTESATESTSSTSAGHTRDVGPLWDHLDIAALEEAVVEDEGIGDQGGLGELDVGVTVKPGRVNMHIHRFAAAGLEWTAWLTYPLGWPVNLSSRIVTRLMEPQLWKCAWISSGDAE